MAGDCKKIKNSLNCDKGEFCVLFLGRQKTSRVCTKIEPEAKLKSYYYGYKGCRNMLLKYIGVDKTASIAITDDFGLQMIQSLQKQGYKNFTIIITDQDVELAKRFAVYIKQAWKDELEGIDIKLLEECKEMKFDLIISNPPYEVGNEITRRIIDTIDYDQFLNLMPLSKYKKNGLYKFVEDKLADIVWGEDNTVSDNVDAFTFPTICHISKVSKNISYETFEHEYIYDQRFEKYWKEQEKRNPSYLRHIYICGEGSYSSINSKTDWCCGIFTPSILRKNGPVQLEGNKISLEEFMKDPYSNSKYRYYVWNFLKPDMRVQDCFEPTHGGRDISQTITRFKSELEKDNFLKWWHSAELNGKYCKVGLSTILLRAMNKTTSCPFEFILPRVDWTKEWTDEEILKDYGYSNEEIKQILHYNDDLIPKGWKEEI